MNRRPLRRRLIRALCRVTLLEWFVIGSILLFIIALNLPYVDEGRTEALRKKELREQQEQATSADPLPVED